MFTTLPPIDEFNSNGMRLHDYISPKHCEVPGSIWLAVYVYIYIGPYHLSSTVCNSHTDNINASFI